MNVYVINMDRDQNRMQAVSRQLDEIGVSYSRFGAIDAKRLPQRELDGALNSFRWWCAVGRSCRIGEIGCALSHYGIYRQMVDRPVCVLEDDVLLDGRFNAVLGHVEKFVDVEKSQVVLLSNHSKTCYYNDGFSIVPARSDMYAEGYVITPKAAQALLKANFPMQCPCDWWGRWVSRGLIELYHAFPTVCSQDQSQYESGTVDSNAFNVENLSLPRSCLHKFLRLIGKTLDRLLPI